MRPIQRQLSTVSLMQMLKVIKEHGTGTYHLNYHTGIGKSMILDSLIKRLIRKTGRNVKYVSTSMILCQQQLRVQKESPGPHYECVTAMRACTLKHNDIVFFEGHQPFSRLESIPSNINVIISATAGDANVTQDELFKVLDINVTGDKYV